MTKRQWAAVVAAVAAEVIVASVAVVVLVRHQRAGLPIGTLGVDVIAGPVIERADGTRVRLPLPADSSVRHAARVPSGWLIELYATSTLGLDGATSSLGLWYVRDGEPAHRIAIFETHWNWKVAPDGQILVATGMIGGIAGGGTAAWQLPRLRLLGQIVEPGDAIGVDGHRVLLYDLFTKPDRALVWDLDTAEVLQTSIDLIPLDMTDDGEVLIHRYSSTSDDRVDCLSVVTLDGLLALRETDQPALCDQSLTALGGWIAPGGAWAVMPVAPTEGSISDVVVNVADLRRGRLVEAPIVLSGRRRSGVSWMGLWDTDDTFIVEEAIGGGLTNSYYRCATDGRCQKLVMPWGLRGARPVLRYGA